MITTEMGGEETKSLEDLTESLEDLFGVISSGVFNSKSLDEKSLRNLRLLYDFLNHGERGSEIHNQLFGYIWGKVHNYQDSEDILSNINITLLRKWRLYNPREPLFPWLFALASNKITDYKRTNWRWIEKIPFGSDGSLNPELDCYDFLDNYPEDKSKTSLDELTENEERSAVGNYLNMLPDTLKQIVGLVYFERLKYREAADYLNIPVGIVKSRLHSAIAMMREIMSWDSYSPAA